MYSCACTCGICVTARTVLQLSVGSVRSKNAKNIVLKNLLDACFGAVCFYLIGYGLAYGGEDHGNDFIGWNGFALNNLPKSEWFGWFFQFAVRSQFPSENVKLGVSGAV